jgi:uncharacterized protein (TIGR03437 family)
MGVDAESTPIFSFMVSGFQRRAGLFWALVSCTAVWAQAPPNTNAPFYTATSVVDAATNQPGAVAPNGLVSLYGTRLSFATRALQPQDMIADALPTALPGTGVRIAISAIAVPILFVSPQQVNFLVPPLLRPGRHKLQLTRDGWTGPEVDLEVAEVAPGTFVMESRFVIATHADGALIDGKAPARPGEVVIVYASGLGQTLPRLGNLSVPRGAVQIERRSQFRLLLNGVDVEPGGVLYAGVTPGFAGLYQINVRLPERLTDNPELRLGIGERLSPGGLLLAAGGPALQ